MAASISTNDFHCQVLLLEVIRSSVLSLLLSGTNELDNESDLLSDSHVCSSSAGLICGLVDATALVDGCVSVDLKYLNIFQQ